MACRLLVKNKPNSHATGDVRDVHDSSEPFGRYESKSVFLAAGLSVDDWPEEFVIINVPDADKADLLYLTEVDEDGLSRFNIRLQGNGNEHRLALLADSETSFDKDTLTLLIKDKGV